MVKMVSLKKSSADRRADKDALGSPDIPSVSAEDQGISVNLDHHHLMKMKVGGGMKSGHKVTFHGTGTVEHSETRSGKDGERHSARLRLDRAGVEHDAPADVSGERGELRSEIMKLHEKSESKSHEMAERKAAKAGKPEA